MFRKRYKREKSKREGKMTIITKMITVKKVSDKMEQSSSDDENSVEHQKVDPESQCPKAQREGYYLVSRTIMDRLYVYSLFLLTFVALTILVIGVIGGFYTYRYFAGTQMHRLYTGWYNIPYDRINESCTQIREDLQVSPAADLFKSLSQVVKHELMDINDSSVRNVFKERFEIDLENEHYEKIEVPDFRDGRQGRYIHDFSINKTGIIDIDGKCCFVMPLNRQRVLPPWSMYDLLKKMYSGYYEVNTKIVRETMKVITPPITDFSSVGTYIARECKKLPTYMLQEVNQTVVKRSASTGIFGEFAGHFITELSILNLEDIEVYQKELQD